MQPAPPAAPRNQQDIDPERLAAERARLVRYCARFTGSADAADDLAQEALVIAWRSRDRLRDAQRWQEWLTGIARNVCMRWRHTHIRDQSRRADDIVVGGATPTPLRLTLDDWPDPAGSDLEAMLERREMLHLLDRAMALLSPRARGVLVDRYVNDLPVAEIAARRGVGEEAAAMQLHRSRQALKRTLSQPELREASVAYGLVDKYEASWQDTRIWCPNCGGHYLKGMLGKCADTGVLTFAVRCPACAPDREGYLHHYAFKPGYRHSNLLAGVKGIKPALNRITAWWDDFAKTAVEKGRVPCMRCERPIPIRHRVPEAMVGMGVPSLVGELGITALCESCKSFRFAGVDDLALNSHHAQEFWRAHPRMRMEPTRAVIDAGGGRLYVTGFRSVTGKGGIDVVVAEKSMSVVAAERVAV